MKQTITVVILAAGLGTRMKSAKAKVLHEAGGDTLLNHIIRAALAVAPAERIVVVTGHQAPQVRARVSVSGVRFAEQREQKGTGHALLCAREEVSDKTGNLLILNGDGPLLKAETLQRLVEAAAGDGHEGGVIATTEVQDPTGYGRILRDERGLVAAIREQKAASAAELNIREINPGMYCFAAEPFWHHIDELSANNPAREYYLTDMVEILRKHGHRVAPFLIPDETELLGINTRVELAVADRILRMRKAEQLMLNGVTIEHPESVLIDAGVVVEADSLIEANVQLRGQTRIGTRCHIGAGSLLRDCVLEDDVTIQPYVVAEHSTVRAKAIVGPFARLRMQAEAGLDTRVGNFVEMKNAVLGERSKAQHLAYLGDTSIGAGSNIGAGTITCNYDGEKKHRTEIADGVFVGSNSTLVAPLSIGPGAYVAAGSVITKPVEEDALAIGRALQVDKEGWARRRRQKKKAV